MTMQDIFPFLLSLLTGAASFMVGRRQAKVAAEGGELENVEKALSIYRMLVGDLKSEIANLRTDMATISTQNILLIKENRELRTKIDDLDHKLNGMNAKKNTLNNGQQN